MTHIQTVIRQATMDDIQPLIELQALAFEDQFRAAFGRRQTHKGIAALVRSHRMQGIKGLSGMYVAQREQQIVGSITLRTKDMRFDDGIATEQAMLQELGVWGTFRATNMLSQLEHHIGRQEAYLSDIAVLPEVRRQGIATQMIRYVAQEARAKSKTSLSLYVSARNVQAQALYYKLGFRQEHMRTSWWNALLLGQRRWIFMVCPLL